MVPYADGVVTGEGEYGLTTEVEIGIGYDCLEEAEWCVEGAVEVIDGVRGAALGEADGGFVGVEVDFEVFVGADEFDFLFPLWFPFSDEGCVFHGSEGLAEWEVIGACNVGGRCAEIDGVNCLYRCLWLHAVAFRCGVAALACEGSVHGICYCL